MWLFLASAALFGMAAVAVTSLQFSNQLTSLRKLMKTENKAKIGDEEKQNPDAKRGRSKANKVKAKNSNSLTPERSRKKKGEQYVREQKCLENNVGKMPAAIISAFRQNGANLGREQVKQLLKDNRVTANTRDKSGASLLHIAMLFENITALQQLIKCGSKINVKDNLGRPVLHLAVIKANKTAMELLIDNGADVSAKDCDGKTAMHLAASSGRYELAKLLVHKGADLGAVSVSGKTVLHCAASSGNCALLNLLVEEGAEFSTKDKSGSTALHSAAVGGNNDVVALLVNLGLGVNEGNGAGLTPLHLAAGTGQLNVVSALVEQNAEIDARDGERKTVLHHAIGKPEMLQFLIDSGADINARCHDDLTPCHLAAALRCFTSMQTLIKNKADIDALDGNGNTALELARKNCDNKMVELISKSTSP